ncbi:hypothetical protein SAMN05192553_10190 [Cyclobacterium xiamenense]|uniref:Uncharacterized protein n=1 Tax=Cyclobacterium xiamenense TaxID=1297121 RepID=A0A1H6TEN6_9BACT|nr:hypothetical protein [Cyclobacterium xiamenense]SEI74750.1 hypothetical protein SAMN05192553_10190 [Cyclobacterium xiamenense]
MKRAIYTLLLLVLISSSAFAQEFPSQVWHDGKVFLSSGGIHEGKVKYDLEANIVQVQSNVIETFSSASISHFEIFDEIYGGIRVFYSLPYALNSDYKTPIFFELLTEGEDITLLCREFITVDNRNFNTMGMRGMYMNPMWGMPMGMGFNRLDFEYFFFRDQKIYRYSQKKRELFNDFMDDRSAEVKLYMRKNRLSHDKRGDLLRITAYYNQIKENS